MFGLRDPDGNNIYVVESPEVHDEFPDESPVESRNRPGGTFSSGTGLKDACPGSPSSPASPTRKCV